MRYILFCRPEDAGSCYKADVLAYAQAHLPALYLSRFFVSTGEVSVFEQVVRERKRFSEALEVSVKNIIAAVLIAATSAVEYL